MSVPSLSPTTQGSTLTITHNHRLLKAKVKIHQLPKSRTSWKTCLHTEKINQRGKLSERAYDHRYKHRWKQYRKNCGLSVKVKWLQSLRMKLWKEEKDSPVDSWAADSCQRKVGSYQVMVPPRVLVIQSWASSTLDSMLPLTLERSPLSGTSQRSAQDTNITAAQWNVRTTGASLSWAISENCMEEFWRSTCEAWLKTPWIKTNVVTDLAERGTVDQISVLRLISGKSWEYTLPQHVCFLDLEEGFGGVPREQIWSIIARTGIPLEMFRSIQSTYHDQ